MSGGLARSLGRTERLKTPDFLAVEARLATIDPHARCNDVANLVSRRSGAAGDLVRPRTEYEDVLREGARAEAMAASAAGRPSQKSFHGQKSGMAQASAGAPARDRAFGIGR